MRKMGTIKLAECKHVTCKFISITQLKELTLSRHFRMMSSMVKVFIDAEIFYKPFVRQPNSTHEKTVEDLKREVGNEHSGK